MSPLFPSSLPDLPSIRLEQLEDLSPREAEGFLRLVRRRYRAIYPDGTVSAPFIYDAIDRRAVDASVIAAHYRDPAGIPWVYLRSAVRPPLLLRGGEVQPGLWELPAGLIEPEEASRTDGPRRSAQRELGEELGFQVALDALEPLGPPTLPSPGVLAEAHFFFSVEVDPEQRSEPTLDGSPLERGGQVLAVPLDRGLAWCREGAIGDTKTELGLRRLREHLT